MRCRLLLPVALMAFSAFASAAHAETHAPVRVAAAPRSPAPASAHAHVALPVAPAAHAAPLPATLHLGASAAHASPRSSSAAAHVAAPTVKAPRDVISFVQKAWNTSAPITHKPYRMRLRGESVPAAVEGSLRDGDSVLVVTRAPDRRVTRWVRSGGFGMSEVTVDEPGGDLPPSGRLYLRRGLDRTLTIYDADGVVVASGNDQVLGAGGDFSFNATTDWSGASLGAAQAMPPTPARRDDLGRFTPVAGKAAAETTRRDGAGRFTPLPAMNPDVKDVGAGSPRLTVPVAGSKLRMFTHDRASFFEGGEETNDADWGGRLVIPQPYERGLDGKARFTPPKIVNVKAIVDVRTGKAVTAVSPVEVEGRTARYEPRSTTAARGDLSLDQYRREGWRSGSPLF